MKVLTNEERPGHQKSCSNRALVLKCLACPVVGELHMYGVHNGLLFMRRNVYPIFEVQVPIGHE